MQQKKVIEAIENNGGVVVAYENCVGFKNYDRLVDEEKTDVYDALAERYFKIGCSVMSPDTYRYALLERLIDEYKVDAVVEVILQACHTYSVELLAFAVWLQKRKNYPLLQWKPTIHTDIGQLSTRLTAFIEML